jgi:hypothetical protein
MRRGLGVLDTLEVGATPSDSRFAEVEFLAPAATVITAAVIDRDMGIETTTGRLTGALTVRIDRPKRV